MEVHHRNITGKKDWKDYFFEFFMLFLAVFCGFLAEWQLERSFEHQREDQYIHSLVEDLKRDTFKLTIYSRFNQQLLLYCDSVQQTLSDPELFKNSNPIYKFSGQLTRFMRYYPTDRTMQQLKNAGNMRLIRKWNVSNSITEYDGKTKLLSELDQQLNSEVVKYRDDLIGFLDLSSYDKMNKPGSFLDNHPDTKGNPGFISNNRSKAKIIYNQVFSIKIFLSTVILSAADLQHDATQLMELLQTEYGIRN